MIGNNLLKGLDVKHIDIISKRIRSGKQHPDCILLHHTGSTNRFLRDIVYVYSIRENKLEFAFSYWIDNKGRKQKIARDFFKINKLPVFNVREFLTLQKKGKV